MDTLSQPLPAMPRDHLFILWGDRFEELETVIFVTALREAGLRVKVVGLSRHASPGAHGLSLLPDITIEQARPMAARALAIIIACGPSGLARIGNDPRVAAFLGEACLGNAHLILGPLSPQALASAGLVVPPQLQLELYQDTEGALALSRTLVWSLSPPR